MSNGVQAPPDPSLTGLVKGIINDLGDLIRQEIRFARAEIKTDWQKTRESIAVLATGAAITLLGVFLLAWMVVHLLHWLTIPADSTLRDPAGLPLWGCFGIVGAVLLAIGAALFAAGKKKLDSFNPLPDETAQTVKENVEWIASSK
jgi:hypothetical protein